MLGAEWDDPRDLEGETGTARSVVSPLTEVCCKTLRKGLLMGNSDPALEALSTGVLSGEERIAVIHRMNSGSDVVNYHGQSVDRQGQMVPTI